MSERAGPDKPHYHGHRQRLRTRLVQKGADSLADYELLELVLFLAQPRRDMKPLAKTLIKRFGSFAEVISAPPERLGEVDGVGETAVAALKSVQAAALRLSQGQILERPVMASWQAVLDYCQASMGYLVSEQFRVFFLDHKNNLIADEVQQQGTIDHTPVYPREIVKRALELGASALILVHNHPSGDPEPSESDVDMTNEVIEAAKRLGILVHDHLIIGKRRYASFRARGLI